MIRFVEEVQVPFLVVNVRVHDVLLLSRLFLDLLVLRHVLDNHLLVVSPLSTSISTSGVGLGYQVALNHVSLDPHVV